MTLASCPQTMRCGIARFTLYNARVHGAGVVRLPRGERSMKGVHDVRAHR